MFDIETLREYCLSQKCATEDLPFGPDVLVFKVMGKMFALVPLDSERLQINLKMDAELVPEYREKYSGVIPGYHMNKRHWISVHFHSDVDDAMIRDLVKNSYELIVKSLTKKQRDEYSR